MRTRTPILLLIVGLLLAMMVGLNVAASRFTGGDEPEAAAESEAPENEPARAPSSPAAMEGANSLARISPSWTAGAKDAKTEVVIGWSWTPAVQANPGSVHSAIMGIVESLRKDPVRVRAVNVDAFPETPAGVSLNGKLVVPLGTDGALSVETAVYAVRTALNQSGGR